MLEEDSVILHDFGTPEWNESLEYITSEVISGSSGLMNAENMLNIMNSEDTTLSLEEYKYIQGDYIQDYPLLYPPAEPSELCNTDYAGPCGFEVFVDPNVMKNPWEYSPTLNKIYIDMRHKFPINFSVKNPVEDQKLFVRIMPMYAEDRYFKELVSRCLCHELPQDATNVGIPEHVVQHIIRCDNNDAQYFGDKNASKRLSIVVPLRTPQPGTDSVKEFFYFVCKSSCVGGMSRRPIQVVFTLENNCGSVLGRRVLCVRICSCPKRDREKDEKKREKHEAPTGKKRKMEKKVPSPGPASEVSDTNVYTVNVVGKENYRQLLKICESLMANEILDEKNVDTAPFKKCRDEATQLLSQLSE